MQSYLYTYCANCRLKRACHDINSDQAALNAITCLKPMTYSNLTQIRQHQYFRIRSIESNNIPPWKTSSLLTTDTVLLDNMTLCLIFPQLTTVINNDIHITQRNKTALSDKEKVIAIVSFNNEGSASSHVFNRCESK